MKKEKHLKCYTPEELQAVRARGEDRTDWQKVDAVCENNDDEGMQLEWSKARPKSGT